MDQGRPLETSPPGPWTGHVESKVTALPVLQKHPKMAFRTTTNRLEMVGNAAAPIQQSATILPLQYDSLIALVGLAHRAPRDPLSVSIPLFAQAAFSEAQFLNLMESKIQMQIKAVANGIPADALGAFQYFSNILDRHVRHLKDGAHALHNLMKRDNHDVTGNGSEALDLGPQTDMSNIPTNSRPPHAGPKISLSDSHGGSFTAKGLLTDYEDLHVRCTELSKMCTRGITLAMNKASIDESRKGIEQSERVKRLTVLATFFIPLNFCSSLFGMNLDILGQSSVAIWWFIILCIPTTLLAYMLYLWDWQAIKRFWARVYKRALTGRPDSTAGSKTVLSDLV
nr:hypothetical protein CFP56_11594 [Quercus suber]